MGYLETIRANYENLTKSEKKVADYIVSTGDKLHQQTLSDIKKATMVGDATIVRFCQKMGYSGFSDLKIAIAKEELNNPESTESSFVKRVEKKLANAIKDTSSLADEKKMKEAASFINQAKNIYIYGVGSSGITALDMESRFLRGGLRVKAITDPHYQMMNASLFTQEDLVIGITLTGKTKDIYDALSVAKKNGAKIISICNYVLSPVAQISDVVLQTAIEEYLLNGGSLTGKISQIFAIDLLITYYEKTYGINEDQMREKIAREIVHKQL
ncbi:RpiR family transcriptional regulator [Enterococcus florum]|uniref:RpiR family transcriptional regulator n=1 Tax=Enterococcus florum TaxID=2480627 RepID=A0A4P5PE34_9ENTE|nr:MurR/RpiR family transcriptional regulator [Enterococcus florum]GCF94368.1 RpiR family transcriptional regulator [Enterococcus florum]